MFEVHIDGKFWIVGCPESGLDAVRWREAHHLDPAPNNTVHIKLDHDDRELCEHPDVAPYLDRGADLWYLWYNGGEDVAVRPEVIAEVERLMKGLVRGPATVAVLNLWRDILRARAERRAELEAEAAPLRDLDDERLGSRFADISQRSINVPSWLDTIDSALYNRAVACARAVLDDQRRAENAAEERRRAEKDARERAEAEEIAAWTAEHGSPRLRRLAAEGIDCAGVYRTERIALEYPGWRFERMVPGEDSDPRNASEAALAMLDEARASAGERTAGAALRFWRYVDEDTNEVVWKGYVAMLQDESLGWLVWGGPQGR